MMVDPTRRQSSMAKAVSESGQKFFMSNAISMNDLVEGFKTVFIANVANLTVIAKSLGAYDNSNQEDNEGLTQRKNRILETIDLQRILSGDKELHLARPVHIAIYFRDRVWVMENEELGIISMSQDKDQCLQDFNSEFLFLWKEYGEADDSGLTSDAKALKSKVLEYLQPENAV